MFGATLRNVDHDEADAREIAALICRSPASVDRYIEFARAEAEAILSEAAESVRALAEAWRVRRTVTGDEVARLVKGG